MRIADLRPGDRLEGSPTGESATLISWSVPHPVYPALALVVWRMGDGRLSLDALDPEQHDVTGSVVVEQSEDQRLESLRRAIGFPDDDGVPTGPVLADEAPRLPATGGLPPESSRYFIAVSPGTGFRLAVKVTGRHPVEPPKGPFPVSSLRDVAAFEEFPPMLIPRTDEALMWEADQAIYQEWNDGEDDDGWGDDED
ncbi:hypothetical protein GCM10009613_60900 [Pseudonocardia kongjuensis]|uniref:DUF3710 domain-containing protein n=1 Tax=Pseudonocardia kongjuensis TaxID=102227 RepID=A0ABN1Y9S2_9PSEU